ncbi:MAG: gamma-glutamyltransferase, partial [Candidatus Eremiobacteraeota bacterium]|nr:gamma-glutamyltransferase [Candidatus Eremiobacteraeota bacterium]
MSGDGLRPTGHRASALGIAGMVTAPHAMATQAGVEILRAGGNAADAGIAVAAALSVLYPHMTGIGGDAFFLYHDAREKTVAAYNGSGASAALADRAFYERLGLQAIPSRGGPAVLTVPGAIDAWLALHERFARLPMPVLLAPAIAHARDGAPIARSLARGLHEEHELLGADPGARALYAAKPEYAIGERLAQPALARSLERIGSDGRGFWYEGEAAALIEACAARAGSPLRAADLAAHRGFFTQPLRSRFVGLDSLTTPPNSQGLVLLIAQGIHDVSSFRERLPADGAALAHLGIESAKLAFEDRDEWIGDPRYLKAPTERLLSDERARVRAADIDPDRASAAHHAGAGMGGTTYFACVDREGNALSMIQSLYFH